MQVRLLAFATAAQTLGFAARDWQLPGELPVSELRRILAEEFPGLAPLLPRIAIAVGGCIAEPATLVQEGAEIALLPPVSGG
jgi:MoaE-MoaD fusion protein